MKSKEPNFNHKPYLTTFLSLKTANSSTLSLSRHVGNDPNKWLAGCITIFNHLPMTITSIDLSFNYLKDCSPQHLCNALNAIPASVLSVNLEFTALFENKKIDEIDNLLCLINKTTYRGEVILDNNGESDFTRAICPMISFARQGLPFDLAFEILSYLKPMSSNPSCFFKTKLNHLLCSQTDNLNLALIQSAYWQNGGSFFKTFQLFTASDSEKLELLKEWSKINGKGASAKTLSHFGL